MRVGIAERDGKNGCVHHWKIFTDKETGHEIGKCSRKGCGAVKDFTILQMEERERIRRKPLYLIRGLPVIGLPKTREALKGAIPLKKHN